jgi:hypothetical protein
MRRAGSQEGGREDDNREQGGSQEDVAKKTSASAQVSSLAADQGGIGTGTTATEKSV